MIGRMRSISSKANVVGHKEFPRHIMHIFEENFKCHLLIPKQVCEEILKILTVQLFMSQDGEFRHNV
jgi:hypothetical protein